MKKTLFIAMIFIIVLSTFLMFVPQIKAPYGDQLTTDPNREGMPSWSPDGTKIVYVYYTGGWYRYLKVMDADGTDQTQLTGVSVVDIWPAFSPDGTKIAFQRLGFRGDYFDLMIMDADGSNVQRITYAPIPGMKAGSYEYPRWSKDGTKLVFQYKEATTAGTGYHWVCTMNVDGTGVEVLQKGMFPRFCCDDSKIIFNTDYQYGDGCISLMNADGTDVQILTDGPWDYVPHMSSTTHRIVFTRVYPEGGCDVFLMNEDGSNPGPITSDKISREGEWSPDEKYIVYASDAETQDIWKMEAPAGGPLPAGVDIDPDTLNLKSNGQWVTAYITLPEGYNVEDIVLETVEAEGIPAEWSEIQDGVYMAKFDRTSVQASVSGEPDYDSTTKFYELPLTVTGELVDGTTFEGSDTITILTK